MGLCSKPKWFCKLGFWGGLQPEKNPSLQSHISRTTFLEKWSQIKRLTVLFGGVSETPHLLIIYKAGKWKFIGYIVEAEIKPDGRSVYKVNHFGAPGVKF